MAIFRPKLALYKGEYANHVPYEIQEFDIPNTYKLLSNLYEVNGEQKIKF